MSQLHKNVICTVNCCGLMVWERETPAVDHFPDQWSFEGARREPRNSPTMSNGSLDNYKEKSERISNLIRQTEAQTREYSFWKSNELPLIEKHQSPARGPHVIHVMCRFLKTLFLIRQTYKLNVLMHKSEGKNYDLNDLDFWGASAGTQPRSLNVTLGN